MAYVHRDPKKPSKELKNKRKIPKQPRGNRGCLGRLLVWLAVSAVVLVLGVYVAIRIIEYLMEQPVVR